MEEVRSAGGPLPPGVVTLGKFSADLATLIHEAEANGTNSISEAADIRLKAAKKADDVSKWISQAEAQLIVVDKVIEAEPSPKSDATVWAGQKVVYSARLKEHLGVYKLHLRREILLCKKRIVTLREDEEAREKRHAQGEYSGGDDGEAPSAGSGSDVDADSPAAGRKGSGPAVPQRPPAANSAGKQPPARKRAIDIDSPADGSLSFTTSASFGTSQRKRVEVDAIAD